MTDTKAVADAAVEAFNAHDQESMRSLYAENATFEAPGDVRLEGPEAISEYAMAWLRAFPDATLTVHSQVIAGESAVHEFTFEGTHDETLVGPAGEIPATHRRLVGRGVESIKVQDGKIVQDHLYFDQVQVMTQLGLMPEPATA
jgi:steroid delta-isomerase-like uncharacterized protein